MPIPRYRLVVLGSAKVGKTSLIQQYLHTQFSDKYKETIEDLHSKRFRVKVSGFEAFVSTSFLPYAICRESILTENSTLFASEHRYAEAHLRNITLRDWER